MPKCSIGTRRCGNANFTQSAYNRSQIDCYMKRILLLLIFSVIAVLQAIPMEAQVDKKDVRAGNRKFKKNELREAEIDYRKGIVKDSLSVASNYNLANVLYRDGDFEQASSVLGRVKEVAPASASAADYYFNVGDVAVAKQDWQGAVDAFKESLLRNPGDLEAKENYIYAKKKLEEQQQNQQNQNDQNNDQNQDNNQNDQNQNNDDQQDKKDDNDDQNKNDQNNDQDSDGQKDQPKQQPSQGQQPKITPQAAQQMLQAIQAKEKETQDKVNKQKAEALKSRQKDKNW